MKNNYKIIFFGSPEFAIPSLEALLKEGKFNVICVVTQPDQPKGRGKTLSPTPVKELAVRKGVPVLEPQKLDPGVANQLKNLKPDLGVTCAYGKIIPGPILENSGFGMINVHPSLLPKYRGPSPIQSAILNGDKKTGITIMLMDSGLDTGDILAQKEVQLLATDTAGSLHDKLAKIGADFLIRTALSFIEGKIRPQKQDDSQDSVTKKISKTDGQIDWSQEAGFIARQIRAMTPWPSAWTKYNNLLLKIRKATITDKPSGFSPGTVIKTGQKMAVICGQGQVVVNEIQRAGKNWCSGQEFLKGFSKIINGCLG